MTNRKSPIQSDHGSKIVSLVDFRRNSQTDRKLSAECARRELKLTILSLSNHVLSCAELVAKCGKLFDALDDVEVRHD